PEVPKPEVKKQETKKQPDPKKSVPLLAKSAKPTPTPVPKPAVKATPTPLPMPASEPAPPLQPAAPKEKDSFVVEVCAESGLLPVAGICANKARRRFTVKTVPTRNCD